MREAASSDHWLLGVQLLEWELYLAREEVTQKVLPWQKPQAPEKMTPGRVQRGMSGVLAGIGTPAQAPKPRGKSPGWSVGRVRTKRVRQAAIKKQSQQTTPAKNDAPTHHSRAT